ncbi:AAA family ATPase [Agromyces sp. Marseille-Q5079]|uniref:AAA family ATPase n=1 Tax=Agromyces sp. Marseille-Q5079 TaxID=3439059 RepID=UPI003D9C88C8
MTPFTLVSRSVEYESRLRFLLGERLRVVPGEYMLLGSETVADRAGEPRIVVLGPVLNFEETRQLIRELTQRNPNVVLVVVREQRSELEDWVDQLDLHAVLSPDASDEVTLELFERLMRWMVTTGRAEAADFEVPTPTPDEVRAIVEGPFVPRVDEAEAEDAPVESDETAEAVPAGPRWEFPPLPSDTPSEALAVVAPKGGQGKTTMSINLASGLAEVAPNSVVLVDADLQFGDITAALALQPEHTIVDAVAAVDDELVLKTMLTHHRDGFFVIASAPSPEFADQVPAAALGVLIERLRKLFRYVIIDTTPGLGEHSLVVLEHVTDAVFVMNMGVPSLRAVRTEFELLRTVGLMPANRHIVVNFADKQSGLTVRDVEHIIGAPVDVEVPRSSAVLLASNRGVPLIHDDVRDPAARGIRSLVMRIAPEAFPKRTWIHRKRPAHEPQ